MGLILVVSLLGCAPFNRDLSRAPDEIIKSDADSRLYRSLILDNRLQVLLISDPETDQAAAAMDVAVGQINDPPERQGLAHFLEHMLFLGTDKFPDADAYSSYISSHGGHSNAFTALEDTNYFFSIHKDYLEGALDRFSQFFISPRFDTVYAEREINAVNSEHQKNINIDQRRVYQIIRNTANPNHPFNKFGTGNLETLRGGKTDNSQLHDQLLRFYKSHYSSNLMKLVILGKESLEDLEKLARTYFTAVPDRNIKPFGFAGREVLERPLSREITIQPVKSIRQLRLMFPIPAQQAYYKSKPAELLSHLLGDEGKGSILALLRKKGFATSLTAGTGPDSRDFSFISVSIGLTPEGLQQTDSIITTVFQYLEQMKREQSLEGYFHESRKIADVAFRFREKEEPGGYASRLSMNMQDVPIRHVLVSPWLHETYQADLSRDLLDALTPENMQVILIAPGVPTDRTDPWYGTQYGVKSIPEERLSKWKNVALNPELFLPLPNPFIVENITFHQDGSNKPYPVLLKRSERSRVWFKQDNVFKVPKGNLRIRLSTPDAYSTAKNAAMTRLFTLLLKEELNEYSYPAVIAGLYYSVHNSVKGIELSLGGYSDNLDTLFHKVVDEIRWFKIDEDRFRIIKNQMMENRQNMKLSQAYRQAGYEMVYLLSTPFWHTDEYLDVIDSITVAELSDYLPVLFSRLHIDFLAHGNFTMEEVKGLSDYLESQLKASRPVELPIEKTMMLPDGQPLVYQFQVPDNNSAIEIYYQAGPESIRQAVALDMIQQIIEKPFYHQLRTIEQLGYLVWSGYRDASKVDGFIFIIQSNVKDPVYLQSRIEQFITEFDGELAQMTEDTFTQFKEALIARRREAPKNLQEETLRYWTAISSGWYDFERREKEIKELQTLSLAEVRKLFRTVFINAKSVKKVTIQAVGKGHLVKPPKGNLITNPREFKGQMKYYPNPDGQVG